MTKKITSIVLAAGKGTRMNSSLPKPLHSVAGKPMLSHIIENINAANINDIIVVINNESDDLKNYLNKNHPNVRTCVQENQNGTGDAVKSVFDNYDLSESDGIVVIFGDTPLLKLETIQKLSESSLKSDLTIMAFEAENPKGYGRIILKDNKLHSIVEEINTTEKNKNIKLCNGGLWPLKIMI